MRLAVLAVCMCGKVDWEAVTGARGGHGQGWGDMKAMWRCAPGSAWTAAQTPCEGCRPVLPAVPCAWQPHVSIWLRSHVRRMQAASTWCRA